MFCPPAYLQGPSTEPDFFCNSQHLTCTSVHGESRSDSGRTGLDDIRTAEPPRREIGDHPANQGGEPVQGDRRGPGGAIQVAAHVAAPDDGAHEPGKSK